VDITTNFDATTTWNAPWQEDEEDEEEVWILLLILMRSVTVVTHLFSMMKEIKKKGELCLR
jgi:hypothetical protein